VQSTTSYSLYGIPVLFKDAFVEPVDLNYVIETIEDRVPRPLFYGVDTIIIGEFEDFVEKSTNAKYENGSIMVSNQQDDEDDLIDDIVHEAAHAVEESNPGYLYSDGKIEVEFLGKRKRLFHLLKQEFSGKMDVWAKQFMNPEYSRQFDRYLYEVLGYPLLTTLSMGLFVSPYAITSLREYFSTGFEEYFLKDQNYLKNISPAVYNKIEGLLEDENR